MTDKPLNEAEWLKAQYRYCKQNEREQERYAELLEAIIVSLAAALPESGRAQILTRLEDAQSRRRMFEGQSYAVFVRLSEIGWERNDGGRIGQHAEEWIYVGGEP